MINHWHLHTDNGIDYSHAFGTVRHVKPAFNQQDSSIKTFSSLVFYFIFYELRVRDLRVMRDLKELHENQRETKQKH